ncbi:TylF/MycF family methyltransferase [Flavobacteriaceae bacterium]|nr:TylF/MycF family methyltransferase [Flavobacteriaceae bacterium]
MKKFIKDSLGKLGLQISRIDRKIRYPVEFTKRDIEIFDYVNERDLTMIGKQRMFSNILIAKYIVENQLEGDFVECGVWRGGSTLLVKMIFEEYGNNSKVWLFDTFKGMTEPTDDDINIAGQSAKDKYFKSKKKDYVDWVYASYHEVKDNFLRSGVNIKDCEFVKGDVLKTIPEYDDKLKKISFLRLDTDWYESTRIELDYFYPKIVNDGFLVIDDYGHWGGSRKATDEYFSEKNIHNFKNIIDYSCRMIRK